MTCLYVALMVVFLSTVVEGATIIRLDHFADVSKMVSLYRTEKKLTRKGEERVLWTLSIADWRTPAQAERINNMMKNELLKDMTFKSVDEVRAAVPKAVEFYNKRRPHMSIDMMTPEEARQYSGPIEKRWRSYREEAMAKNNPAIGLPYASVQGLTGGRSPD